jgi:hypothetical protein
VPRDAAWAQSLNQHNIFTIAMPSDDRRGILSSAGFAITIARLFARDTATLSRFLLYGKSMKRGMYSPLEVVVDTMNTSVDLKPLLAPLALESAVDHPSPRMPNPSCA